MECLRSWPHMIFVCFICFTLRSKRKHQQKRLYRQLGSFVSNARNPSTPTHGQWRRKPVHDESLNPIYNLILLYQIKTQPSVGQAARHQEKQRRSCAVHMQSGCGLRIVVGWKRVWKWGWEPCNGTFNGENDDQLGKSVHLPTLAKDNDWRTSKFKALELRLFVQP